MSVEKINKWVNPSRVREKGFNTKGLPVNVKELVKIYSTGKGIEVQALRGVNLYVGEGEAVTIMGPSGSGKTTLLNIIGGVDRPTGGEVIVGDIKVHELSDDLLEKYRLSIVGYVFQAFNLIPVLTAIENVALPMIAFNVPRNTRVARAKWLLEIVGLSDRLYHKPYELSGGQQQRVAIAVALANDPPLILADEPTAELDTENAMNIINLLTKLSIEHGKTVIVSTHDPRMAVRTKKIFRLEDGRIKGEYKPMEITGGVVGREAELSEVLKTKLASVEKEFEELIEKFKKHEISLEEFDRQYTRLKNYIEVLRDLLRSMGH